MLKLKVLWKSGYYMNNGWVFGPSLGSLGSRVTQCEGTCAAISHQHIRRENGESQSSLPTIR